MEVLDSMSQKVASCLNNDGSIARNSKYEAPGTTMTTIPSIMSLIATSNIQDLSQHFQVALPPQDAGALTSERLKSIAAEVLRISTNDSLSKETQSLLLQGAVCADASSTIPLGTPKQTPTSGGLRLNKFVRRLHEMLKCESDSGIVEWRRGLLVLHSTADFSKNILPKYFNTRNFKTFRRQLNYYGFVHVRSFSTTGSTTTALWVNRGLAQTGSDDISSVLMLKRVEPCESAKTAEGRRVRKEQAIHTVEEDLGVNAKTLQMDKIRHMTMRAAKATSWEKTPADSGDDTSKPLLPMTALVDPPRVPVESQVRQATAEKRRVSRGEATTAALKTSDDAASSSQPSSSNNSVSSAAANDDHLNAANLLLMLANGR